MAERGASEPINEISQMTLTDTIVTTPTPPTSSMRLIDGPSAWVGAEMRLREAEWSYRLSAPEVAETVTIDAAYVAERLSEIASSSGVTRRLNPDGGGTSALRTFSISANSVSPRNSFSVVSISCRMMPAENTSRACLQQGRCGRSN